MTTYTLASLQATLGLSRTVVSGLIKSGVVTPTRGAKREYRFSFQDMVLLRTAHSLQTARVAPRKILTALAVLRAQLPQELPLTGLRIAVAGGEVTVREGGAEWAVLTGQGLMDFEWQSPRAVTVRVVELRERSSAATTEIEPLPFDCAVACESEGDAAAAEQAYRRAIATGDRVADASLNLGVLLTDASRADAAVQIYIEALKQVPEHALLHYNLAVALEDAGSPGEALAAYEACLALEPTLSDAHFNAGRLYEQTGDRTRALRHYAAYRRLEKS